SGAITVNGTGANIDASGNGPGDCGIFDGGSIKISADTVGGGVGSNTLGADASGSGDGGSVKVTAESASTLGGASLAIFARGGSPAAPGFAGSVAGDGGTVIVKTGGEVDITALDAAPRGLNGNGAHIELEAVQVTGDINASGQGIGNGGTVILTTPTGDLLVTGNITADGGRLDNGATFGIGNGGSITVTTTSATPFVIDASAMTNGIQGPVSAQAGVTSGNGGSIVVKALGTGGVSIGTAANLSV